MLLGDYKFHCRFETGARLPPYKGSTFRGLFGTALKRVVCALKTRECSDCILKASCLYSQMFEPAGRPGLNGSSPHPFVIEPSPDTRSEYAPGDEISCGMLLFGGFNQSLAHVVYAFSLMGEIGMGARIHGTRGRFQLERVTAGNGNTIFSKDSGALEKSKLFAEDVVWPESVSISPGESNRVRVNFKTPCRFKSQNRLSDRIDFEMLVRLMLRRISSLFEALGDGEPALDYRGLVSAASAVRSVENNLRWLDWERYSNRQETRMSLGGVVGPAVYEGDLAPYLPLLDFCARTHIGKQTSFGLGKIEIEVLE